jgi:hypothetical protein
VAVVELDVQRRAVSGGAGEAEGRKGRSGDVRNGNNSLGNSGLLQLMRRRREEGGKRVTWPLLEK